jgi:hypothetical protein
MLKAKWSPVLLNADRRIRSVENFQGPHQESKLRSPALWRITLYTRVILILNLSANWRIVANLNPSHGATGEEHGYPLNRRLNVLCIWNFRKSVRPLAPDGNRKAISRCPSHSPVTVLNELSKVAIYREKQTSIFFYVKLYRMIHFFLWNKLVFCRWNSPRKEVLRIESPIKRFNLNILYLIRRHRAVRYPQR